MKTFKLIYLDDHGLHVMEYSMRFCSVGTMREVGGKERLLTIDESGCYKRLMHVCKDGRRRTIGQYPSFDLGKDWSDSLREKYADELLQARLEIEGSKVDEDSYHAALRVVAEMVVTMVQEDYSDVETQRGEVGNYLQPAIDDIQNIIDEILA